MPYADEAGLPHPQLKALVTEKYLWRCLINMSKNQKGLFNFKNVAKSDRHMPDITENAAYDIGYRGADSETQKVIRLEI